MATKKTGFGRWMYCKYCYKNTRPLCSFENLASITDGELEGIFVQAVCGECGAGLTPPERVEQTQIPSDAIPYLKAKV